MTPKVSLLAAVLLSIVHLSVGAGKCSNLSPMEGFNSELFSGRWYEIKRFKTPLDAFGGSCAAWNFTQNSDNSLTINVSVIVKNKPLTTKNKAAMNADGSLNWKIKVLMANIALTYYILDTDYYNYAVAYACANVPFIGNIEVAWILSRGRTLHPTYLYRAMENNNVDQSKYIDANQNNCKN